MGFYGLEKSLKIFKAFCEDELHTAGRAGQRQL